MHHIKKVLHQSAAWTFLILRDSVIVLLFRGGEQAGKNDGYLMGSLFRLASFSFSVELDRENQTKSFLLLKE
jgi:hypothetical protein